MSHIAIIGAGGWGTALGLVAGRAGHAVRLWSRNAEVVEGINVRRVNGVYLAGHKLAGDVRATCELGEAVRDARIVILAAPSHATRELLERMAGELHAEVVVVSATKGIEIETGQRISEVAGEVLGKECAGRFVCLSGPSFAQEVAAGHPTAVVAAGYDARATLAVQAALSFENFRVYTNGDLVGTELGGAVKNVIALAAGMVSGLGLGTNSIAALITRGLSEITRLALAEGGRVETLAGLAGMGDLVLTCTGALSRNRYVGQELGRGRALAEILSGMHEVAEGVRTTRAVKLLAESREIEMPITEQVHAVLYEGKSARAAAEDLMARPLRGEFAGMGL
ncbi:MAG: glycerol-3-phosphate dehydrogenase [Pyrinomonadaceae bacterium]|jgi:glycerol-3-phosphate dehydrogenase (NAD(P)+)|nr:glycerol-3-phosphate dehydrogenase [Pyrinomonadaceae bacterium]